MTIWHDLLTILAVAVVAILVAVALAVWFLSKISHDVAIHRVETSNSHQTNDIIPRRSGYLDIQSLSQNPSLRQIPSELHTTQRIDELRTARQDG